MPDALLLATLLATFPAPHGTQPAEPLPPLSALVAAPAPAPPQDYQFGLQPAGWVTFGVSFLSSTLNTPTVNDPDDRTPLNIELGLYGWQGEVGLGVEAGLMQSSYEAQVSSLDSEDVDVWRATVGVRVADRGSGDRFLPWAHAGFLYRVDDGDVVSDNGPGFYVGGGFDFVLIGGLAVSPQVMYQQSTSFDAKEWIGTLGLTYLF